MIKKNIHWFVITLTLISSHTVVWAQGTAEKEIQLLESNEREAVLKNDTATLYELYWSKDFLVNTPSNKVSTLADIKQFFRSGKIVFSTYDRVVEKIMITQNMAVVMGYETIKPQGATDNAGKSVTRRFTNIWIKEKRGWRLTARQATNITVE
jgi:hypothetical protein